MSGRQPLWQEFLMARMLERLDDHANAFAQLAQPLVVAMSSAGLTGGVMAFAGLLAGRVMRRH